MANHFDARAGFHKTFRPCLWAGIILGACLAAPMSSQATVIASDNAGNYSSWSSGNNQGTGFGAWSFANSTPSGGYSGEYLAHGNGGSAVSSGNGNAWALYSNSSPGNDAQANAIRSFNEGNLTAGQTLGIQMNNGSVGGSVGFSLRDSSHNNIFEFYFNGGANDYTINVSGTAVTTTVPFTASALNLAFTQGSGDSWSFSINGVTYSSSSTGDNLSANDISEIRLFSYGNNNDIFFNNLAITAVPEPIKLALPIFGGLMLAAGLGRRFVFQRAEAV